MSVIQTICLYSSVQYLKHVWCGGGGEVEALVEMFLLVETCQVAFDHHCLGCALFTDQQDSLVERSHTSSGKHTTFSHFSHFLTISGLYLSHPVFSILCHVFSQLVFLHVSLHVVPPSLSRSASVPPPRNL